MVKINKKMMIKIAPKYRLVLCEWILEKTFGNSFFFMFIPVKIHTKGQAVLFETVYNKAF